MPVQFTQSHPVTAEAVKAHMDAGTTEKRAVALVLRDAGYTNQAGGDAFADLFGEAVKSGGFGNLVTGALRDVGRGDQITSASTGTRAKAVSVDPVQQLRDSRDRERAALDNVQQPVIEAEALLTAITDTPDDVVAARQAAITEQMTALNAEAKALKADPKPYLDATREKATARRDAAKVAAGDRAKTHQENIERYELVLSAMDAMNAPADA